MNIQSNPVCEKPVPSTSGHQGATSDTPVHLNGPPSVSISIDSAVILLPEHVNYSSDWTIHTSGYSKYYYNTRTMVSTWYKPLELMTALERAVATTTDWNEYTSRHDGREWFYNTITKQKQWEIPEEVKRAREQAEKASSTREVDGISNATVILVSDVKTPSNSKSGKRAVMWTVVAIFLIGLCLLWERS